MSTAGEQRSSLVETLDAVAAAGDGAEVSVGDILEAIGPRGFGPLLLVPAAVVITPASAIPLLSSAGGLIIAAISAQYLIGRNHAWLPRFLRERTIGRDALEKGIGVIRKPAGWIDTVVTKRLSVLTHRPMSLPGVGACFVLGAIMPLFEVVPTSSTILASVVAVFALAITARDGILMLVGYAGLALSGWGILTLLGWI